VKYEIEAQSSCVTKPIDNNDDSVMTRPQFYCALANCQALTQILYTDKLFVSAWVSYSDMSYRCRNGGIQRVCHLCQITQLNKHDFPQMTSNTLMPMAVGYQEGKAQMVTHT
jgi:hypothetical protein